MRKLSPGWTVCGVLACVSLALAACGKDEKKTTGGGAAAKKPNQVLIEMTWDATKGKDKPDEGYVFVPNEMEVQVSAAEEAEVVWINKEFGNRIMTHTATHRVDEGKDPRFDELVAATNGKMSKPVVFTAADIGKTFEYYCKKPHPSMQKAKITVVEKKP